ncbi:MAG TPA: TorF family putative porin [Ferrovibrio sp.]|jgi:uncharacterized protein (TIGR02001 family)|uniref:TorF family putative porin n=1 Tax=Ferrovibrio sp. TaxID=1917215 RepID=UPI002ED056D1
MKKVVFQAALLAMALIAGQARAEDDRLSATATLGAVSEYYFRGISQTDGSPAIQPGIEGDFQINDTVSGYLGLWGSNVNFHNGTKAEVDVTGGFRFTFDKLGFDLGVVRYEYLDTDNAPNQPYTELKLLGSYDFGYVIPVAGVYMSNDYFNGSGRSIYYTAGVTVPIPVTQFEPRLVANIGHQVIDDNAAFGTPDYTDWNVGLFASYWGFTAGIQYVDNNLSSSECFGGGNGSLCAAAVIASLSYGITF